MTRWLVHSMTSPGWFCTGWFSWNKNIYTLHQATWCDTDTSQVRSDQFMTSSTCSGKTILHPVSRKLSKCCLWNSSSWSDRWRPFLILSRSMIERFLFLHLSPPMQLRMWCPWLHVYRKCLKLLNASDLPRCRSLVKAALPGSLSAESLLLTPLRPGQSKTVV